MKSHRAAGVGCSAWFGVCCDTVQPSYLAQVPLTSRFCLLSFE